jgi:hypothetical protein
MNFSQNVNRLLITGLLVVIVPGVRGQANDSPMGPSGGFNGNVVTGYSYDLIRVMLLMG